MYSKRFLFLLGGIFLIGIISGLYFHNDKRSFSAALGDVNGCERMTDTNRVQCNFDRGPTCGLLKHIPNTTYIYELPKDVLHDKKNEGNAAIYDCLETYNQTTDTFWTKYVNGTTVTTNEATLQQTPALTGLLDGVSCQSYNPSYLCIDSNDASSLKAYWSKDNQQHYVVNRLGSFYEYVSGLNASNQRVWLYTSVQDKFFTIDPKAVSAQVFKIKVPAALAKNAVAASGTTPAQLATDVQIQFGKILDTGFVQEKTIVLSETTKTNFDSSYQTQVTVQSKQFSEVNVWRAVVTVPGQSALTSAWIPAKVSLESLSVEFDVQSGQLRILNATQSWLKDFNGTHTAQLYNVVTEQIEDNNLGIGGAFILNNNVFLFSNVEQGKQKLFYVLENSGVAPTVSSCSGGEKIHVSNLTAPQRTNYLLNGDTGRFVIIGDSITNATAVTWTISNQEKSRIKNAAEIPQYSSTSANFEVLPEFVGTTQLDNISTITATTQGDNACTMILKVFFKEGLRVGVDKVDVMAQ